MILSKLEPSVHDLSLQTWELHQLPLRNHHKWYVTLPKSALASSLLQFLCWQNIPALQMPDHVTRSKNAFCTCILGARSAQKVRPGMLVQNAFFDLVTWSGICRAGSSSYSSPPHPSTLASQFYFFHTADHINLLIRSHRTVLRSVAKKQTIGLSIW